MILTLEVVNSSLRATFKSAGGSIGRLPKSTLLLEGDSVSRTHAKIHYRDGRFYIEDRSSNGMSLDSPSNRLPREQQVELRSGNVIFIDPYEIRVEISADLPGPAPIRAGSLLDSDQPVSSGLTGFLKNIEASSPPPRQILPENWQEDSGLVAVPPVPPVLPGPPEPVFRPIDTPPRPPHVDVDHKGVRPTPVRPAPPRPAPPAGSTDATLAALLAGAGLDPDDVTPELAENLGQILRVVVSGVMDMLAARQQTKEEFRIDVTRFMRQGDVNNPLKFSTNAKDALHNLLVKRQEGYLGAVDAFEDAFADLRDHQMATLLGVRAAFAAMLARFDPGQLQEQFDRQQRGSLVPSRLRYWDLYGEWFRDMVGDVDASFRTLFGEEFGEAYEEHLRRLKAQGRSGDPRRDGRS